MIMGIFTAMSWAARLATVGVLVASLLAIGTTIYVTIHKRGQDYAYRQIAAGNKKAIDKSLQYRGTFLECRAGGMRWDTATGKCLRG